MAIGTQIPSQIVEKIIPILSGKMSTISNLANKTALDCLNLPPETQCSDPLISKVKQQLADLQILITELDALINSISSIASSIQLVATVATALKLIQLAIPMVPGIPSGPITELINIFTKLIENSKSGVGSITNILENIKSQFNSINSNIANSIKKLASICSNEQFETSADVARLVNPIQLTPDFASKFYTTINVSQDDIDFRVDSIQDLLDDQINVMQNLIEAPSKVITSENLPVTTDGNINDYFVNTTTNQIFGPKTNEGWGTPVN
jgi:hypothetical protein